MNKFTVAYTLRNICIKEMRVRARVKVFLLTRCRFEMNRIPTNKKIVKTFVPILRYGIRVKTSKA